MELCTNTYDDLIKEETYLIFNEKIIFKVNMKIIEIVNKLDLDKLILAPLLLGMLFIIFNDFNIKAKFITGIYQL